MNRNDLARDTVSGALVLIGNTYGVNGYEYRYVTYLDNGQRATVSVEELRPVKLGPEKE